VLPHVPSVVTSPVASGAAALTLVKACPRIGSPTEVDDTRCTTLLVGKTPMSDVIIGGGSKVDEGEQPATHPVPQ